MLNGMADGALAGAISGAVTGALTSPYCFVAGTAVLAAAGAVAIETIQAGDMVWAWDEETGEVALKEVVEAYVNETYELVHVFVNGEEIVTTPGHPFYSPVKGWTDAVNLRAGDVLILVNGEYVVVEKIQHEILETSVTVYNFQVEDFHTYYVTDAGVLVHNLCDDGMPATSHGKIRIGERGLTQHEYELLKASQNVRTQADGATVYIRALNSNNHNVLVENDVGEIITFMTNVTKRGLRNLANNYGWI
jgi:hypothetical protein